MATASNKQSVARLRALSGALPARTAYWLNSGIQNGTLGIAATTAAPSTAESGVGLLDGAYTWYVVQYDSLHTSMGNPQVTAATRTVSLKKVTLTFADTASGRATHRRIYRNTAGGSVFYLIATVAVGTATYEDNTADSSLSVALGTLETDNDRPPSTARGLFVHGARGFALNGTALVGSKASNLDQWPPLNTFNVGRDDGTDLKWGGSFGGDIILLKEKGAYIAEYDINPFDLADGRVGPLNPDRGALNEFCVVNVAGQLIAMDNEHIYAYTGGENFVPIDSDIAPLLERRNMQLRDWFCAVADDNTVRFFLALKGDGATTAAPSVRWALKLDLRTLAAGDGPQWWLEYYDHPIRDARVMTFGSNTDDPNGGRQRRATAMISLGYHVALDMLTNDGVHPKLTALGTLTNAVAGASTTVITAAGTFDDLGSYNVVGLYCRFIYANGLLSLPYPISVASDGEFTVTGVVSPLPANGDTFLIGGIQGEYRTPILQPKDVDERVHVKSLSVWFAPVPSAARKANSRVIHDRRGEQPAGLTFSDTILTGTVNDPVSGFLIDGAPNGSGGRGCQAVAAGATAASALQFILSVFGPDVPLSVSRLEVIQEPTDGGG